MLWYDLSNFEKAGIETPWTPETWDDVLGAFAAYVDRHEEEER